MQDRHRSDPAFRRFFPDEIRRNRTRLHLALIAFFLLAFLAGQATGKAFLFLADPDQYYALRYGVGLDGMSGPDSSLFGYVNQVTFAVLLLAWVQYRRMSRRGDRIVLSLVRSAPLKERQVLNTGEEMAIAAGIGKPRIRLVDSPELNAFSCARGDGRATIALTRGLLDRLSRDQIQAVVAHEMAHIGNGDARLMTMMLGMGRAFHLVSALALGPLRAIFDAGVRGDAEQGREDTGPAVEAPTRTIWERPATRGGVLLAVLLTPVAALALLALGVAVSLALLFGFGLLILLFPWLVAGLAAWELLRDHSPKLDAWIENRAAGRHGRWRGLLFFVPVGLLAGPAILVLGILVPLMLVLMRLAVSRNREFQADAVAVRLTRNPGALRSALTRIHEERALIPGPARLPGALSPLAIVAAERRWSGSHSLVTLLSTHPPLQQRIRRLAEMEGSPEYSGP